MYFYAYQCLMILEEKYSSIVLSLLLNNIDCSPFGHGDWSARVRLFESNVQSTVLSKHLLNLLSKPVHLYL